MSAKREYLVLLSRAPLSWLELANQEAVAIYRPDESLCDMDRTNCHGWLFANGQGWIQGSDVESILQGDDYYEVVVPEPGDVVIYRDDYGEIIHSGLVHSISLIESKWGKGPVCKHPVGQSPYGNSVAYYHQEGGF